MSDRITRKTLDDRVANLNRRLNPGLAPSTVPFHEEARYVEIEGRNGHFALDEYRGTTAIRTITAGTKREVADFLHAAMVGIDLANVEAEGVREAVAADYEALKQLGGMHLADPATRALTVLILDPAIRVHLDPKALAQARSALGLEA